MKVLSLCILRWQNNTAEPVILSSAYELTEYGYFKRGPVKEMLTFFTRTIVKRTEHGQRVSIQNEQYNGHVFLQQDGLAACAICDLEYPPRVAFVMIGKLLAEFQQQYAATQWEPATADNSLPLSGLEESLARYQDPAAADQITRIQRELDETTEVLHQTIDQVLERGAKLEDLVERSNDLTAQSKMFYKQARKTNSCCVVS